MIASTGKAQQLAATKQAQDSLAANENPDKLGLMGASVGSMGGFGWGTAIGAGIGELIGIGQDVGTRMSKAGGGNSFWSSLGGAITDVFNPSKAAAALTSPAGITAATNIGGAAARRFAGPAVSDGGLNMAAYNSAMESANSAANGGNPSSANYATQTPGGPTQAVTGGANPYGPYGYMGSDGQWHNSPDNPYNNPPNPYAR